MQNTETQQETMMDDDGMDDTILCGDGIGAVEVESDALTEAIFRWRRGEKREALYHLERAFGSHFDGLGELEISEPLRSAA